MRGLIIIGLLTLGACGSPALKLIGEPCIASSECGDGLVCDTGVYPAVCAMNLTRVDASPDAGPADARVDASPDAPPGAPDASVPDAAVPDAALPDASVPDASVPDA